MYHNNSKKFTETDSDSIDKSNGRSCRLCKLNCVSAHNSINYFKHRIKDEQTHGRQET